MGRHLNLLRFCLAVCFLVPFRASAHPHVFAESQMELVGDEAGHLRIVRDVWRMDELFSATVLVEFDKNKDGVLDDDELRAVGATIKQSIASLGPNEKVTVPDDGVDYTQLLATRLELDCRPQP